MTEDRDGYFFKFCTCLSLLSALTHPIWGQPTPAPLLVLDKIGNPSRGEPGQYRQEMKTWVSCGDWRDLTISQDQWRWLNGDAIKTNIIKGQSLKKQKAKVSTVWKNCSFLLIFDHFLLFFKGPPFHFNLKTNPKVVCFFIHSPSTSNWLKWDRVWKWEWVLKILF